MLRFIARGWQTPTWIATRPITVGFAGRWAAAHIERAYQGRYRMVKNLPRREGCDYGDLAKENYERRAARSLSDGSR